MSRAQTSELIGLRIYVRGVSSSRIIKSQCRYAERRCRFGETHERHDASRFLIAEGSTDYESDLGVASRNRPVEPPEKSVVCGIE